MNERKERILQLDRQILWHPYTQMKDYEESDPLCVERGEGVFLFDMDGTRYYDTISSWWCILHGHNHPVIKNAIKKQLDHLEQVHFANTLHEPGVFLAEKLVKLLPTKLSRVFYSDNGSTACEVAVKMSVQYWKLVGEKKREKIVSLERGYHGDTIGAMSLGGVPDFKGPFDSLTFESYRIPSPYCYRCPMDQKSDGCSVECLDPLEALLKDGHDKIAAVIVEPLLQGAGGMIVYPAKYLERLAALIRPYSIHLIFDEVATGFGRTGTMFALEQTGVVPDFICLSKGLTGGYLPMAATVTTDEIFNAFYGDYSEGRTFFHGHTFTGNPLACAAALGSMEVFEKERVMEGLGEKVAALEKGARDIGELSCVGDVRCIGMVAGFELVRDRSTREPYSFEYRAGWRVYLEGLKNGVILRPLGNVTYLFLPLCTTVDQIEDIIDRTRSSISSALLDSQV